MRNPKAKTDNAKINNHAIVFPNILQKENPSFFLSESFFFLSFFFVGDAVGFIVGGGTGFIVGGEVVGLDVVGFIVGDFDGAELVPIIDGGFDGATDGLEEDPVAVVGAVLTFVDVVGADDTVGACDDVGNIEGRVDVEGGIEEPPPPVVVGGVDATGVVVGD